MLLDGRQILIEDVCPCEGWAGYQAAKFVFLTRANQLNVNALALVFHGFSKYTVLHELGEVLLEVTDCLFPELGVQPDVGLHPRALLESEGSVNLREAHTYREVQLQFAVVVHIAFLVVEVGYQLLNLGRCHLNI